MALSFAASSGYLDLSSPTALDGVRAGGYVAVVKPSSAGTTRVMYHKGADATNRRRFSITTVERVSMAIGPTATGLTVEANLSAFAAFRPGKWVVIAARFDTTLTNADQQFFVGSRTDALLPPSAYTTQVVGTVWADDTTEDAHIGDSTINTLGFTDPMAAFAVFAGGYPSLADLQRTARELMVRGRELTLPSGVKAAYQLTKSAGRLLNLNLPASGARSGTLGGTVVPVTDFVWDWPGGMSVTAGRDGSGAVVAATAFRIDRRRRYAAVSP